MSPYIEDEFAVAIAVGHDEQCRSSGGRNENGDSAKIRLLRSCFTQSFGGFHRQ